MVANDNNGYGLFWPYLFSLKEEKTQHEFIKNVKQSYERGAQNQFFHQTITPRNLYNNTQQQERECLKQACERVVLKFMLFDTDLANEFLSEEELTKAKETYQRKQYTSNLPCS